MALQDEGTVCFKFFRSSPLGSHKERQRVCPVGKEGRKEGARGPVVRGGWDKLCQEREQRELMTAGSHWSSPGAWEKLSNSEQPQWFLHSHCSVLPLLLGLSLSYFYAFLPSVNTSSPAFFQTFPPKHSPSGYTQWTLPVLLCPSKLNSSRGLGRGTYPKSEVGRKNPENTGQTPCGDFSSWRDAQLGWGEEGCCGQTEHYHRGTGGLALTAHQELGSFPWHIHCITSACM